MRVVQLIFFVYTLDNTCYDDDDVIMTALKVSSTFLTFHRNRSKFVYNKPHYHDRCSMKNVFAGMNVSILVKWWEKT